MKTSIFALTTVLLLVFPGVSQQVRVEGNKVLEPADYWTAIANDEQLESWRRAVSIYLLFERHVKKDITLNKLADLLNKPKWIKEKAVSVVEFVFGFNVPLETSPEDTLLSVLVFSNKDLSKHKKEAFGILIKVSGRMDRKEFIAAIMKQEKTKHGNAKIKAWAMTPTWDEFVQRIAVEGKVAK